MSTITIHTSASTHVCDQWAPVCRSSLVFITLMSELSFVQLLHNPALQTVKVTNHPSAVFLDRLASQISLYACFTCPHTRCTHSIFMRVANWHAKVWPETGQESPRTKEKRNRQKIIRIFVWFEGFDSLEFGKFALALNRSFRALCLATCYHCKTSSLLEFAALVLHW